MDTARITYLFYRHFDETATPEEKLELAEVLQQNQNEGTIKSLMEEAWESFSSSRNIFKKEKSQLMLDNVLQRLKEKDPVPLNSRWGGLSMWPRILAAVSVLLVLGLAMYYFVQSPAGSTKDRPVSTLPTKDIAPGSSKAMLTLSDGSTISLDQAADGILTRQGSSKVVKVGEGQLAYELTSDQASKTVQYNTLRTPRGGQYGLVLPDGSKVWLNAASSIRYPITFNAQSRDVEITGEVYFEVNKVNNPGKNGAPLKVPFVVKASGIQVEVLGTHFNVNAYNDEGKVRTTLLEGVVRVHKGNKESLLKPGQEASVSQKSSNIQVKNVEVSEAVAWKNGYFQFHQAGLPEIMRQLTKWYDVEVRYESDIPERQFTGEIPRSATLSQVLEILEISKVQLNVEGKEIVVKP